MSRSHLPLGLTLALFAPIADAGETILDSFDSDPVGPGVDGWTLSYPDSGAVGSLHTVDAGHTGNAAALYFDFNHGGSYVQAGYRPPSPITAAGVSFWMNSPPGVGIGVKVYDSCGQAFQYFPARPLAAQDAGAWYFQTVELDAPMSWYDGIFDGGNGCKVGVPAPPFSEIDILARKNEEQVPTAGTIVFDDLGEWDVLQYAFDPWSAPQLVPAAATADCQASFGVNIHYTNDLAATLAIADAGFRFVRADLKWASVEPGPDAGVYGWAGYDVLVAQLADAGLRPHFIFDYGNPLYNDPSAPPPTTRNAPVTAAAIAAYGAYAGASAQHFASLPVKSYEIWNEPDVGVDGGDFGGDAGWYSRVAQAAVTAVRKADPTAPITTAGLGGYDLIFFDRMLATGGDDGADAVSFHPYRQGGAESDADDLLFARSLVTSLSPIPAVWQSEWGYSATWYLGDGGAAALDGGRQRQAVLVARQLLTSCALQSPMNVYYDIRDDGTDAGYDEDNFGLLANDHTPKPAFFAARRALAAMSGRTYSGAWEGVPSDVHALAFTGDAGDALVALWAGSGSAQVSTPVPASAEDVLGDPLVQGGDGGQVLWTVSDVGGPIYLWFPKPARDGGDAGPAAEDAGTDAGPDAGMVGGIDGGIDAGSDGGTDAGPDAGALDAGAPDAGTTPDAGDNAGDGGATAATGCSCGTSDPLTAGAGLLVLAVLRSWRRRGSRRHRC